jgi:hypothetical protein
MAILGYFGSGFNDATCVVNRDKKRPRSSLGCDIFEHFMTAEKDLCAAS